MPLAEPGKSAIWAVALALLAAACTARRPDAPATTPQAQVVAQPTPAPAPTAAPEAAAPPHRNVVLVGDSTTHGTPPPGQGLQSPYQPGGALEALLATLEPLPGEGGTPWRGAHVFNFGVGASSTIFWLTDPPLGCKTLFELYPVVKLACAANVSWVKAVPLAVPDGHVDAVIVDLGINDFLVTKKPAETVDRLETIRDTLAPIPVLFYPPIAPRQGPRGDWPLQVRAEMERRGLFSEGQYPLYVPTFDGLHPTAGGYAAKGSLWLDGLRQLP